MNQKLVDDLTAIFGKDHYLVKLAINNNPSFKDCLKGFCETKFSVSDILNATSLYDLKYRAEQICIAIGIYDNLIYGKYL